MSGKPATEPVSNWGDEVDASVDPVTDHHNIKPSILTNRKVSKVVATPKLYPLHVRIREYNEAKKRIFGEVPGRIKKAIERYKRRKKLKQEISSASLFEGEDARLYSKIRINGVEIEGLLDRLDYLPREKLFTSLWKKPGINIHIICKPLVDLGWFGSVVHTTIEPWFGF